MNSNDSASFVNVMEKTKEMLIDVLSNHQNAYYKQEIIIDNDECFRTILHWEKCIGELMIEKADYSPYRYVSLNILATDRDKIETVFYWCDSNNDTLEKIGASIKTGLDMAFNYSVSDQ